MDEERMGQLPCRPVARWSQDIEAKAFEISLRNNNAE
jgi:hypothetical protein